MASVEGYGTIRTCRSSAKIGPFHAADPRDAQQLLATLAVHAPADGGVSLDIPEPNYAGTALARDLGLYPGVRDRPHVPRPAPGAGPGSRVFAQVSLELG